MKRLSGAATRQARRCDVAPPEKAKEMPRFSRDLWPKFANNMRRPAARLSCPEGTNRLQGDDGEDAGSHQEQLSKGTAFKSAAMQVRNEICHRDIEKVARGEGEHVWQHIGKRLRR